MDNVQETAERTAREEAAPSEPNAHMQLIDARGEVEAKLDATLQHVFSIEEVPETADRSRNFVDVSKVGNPGVSEPDEVRVQIWLECSNGWRACVDIRW